MKTCFCTALFAFIFITISQAQIVSIPDTHFKNKLLTHDPIIDTNTDGEIQLSEAQALTGGLFVNGTFANPGQISDLTGIEAFANITELDCSINQISGLPLSGNLLLEKINARDNLLGAVDVSPHTALIELNVGSNSLIAIDVSNNTALEVLYCNSNAIKDIDVSVNTALRYLEISANQISALDLETNLNLETLSANFNPLGTLDLSNQSQLERLDCTFCELTSLDISNSNDLENLYVPINQLTSLNLSNKPVLEFARLSQNQLTSLGQINSPLLTSLFVDENDLSTLDISNTGVYRITCNDNPNLSYINLKNGINQDFDTSGSSNNDFTNLPNLETVCVDDDTSALTVFIENQVGHAVNFTEECLLGVSGLEVSHVVLHPNPTDNIVQITSSFPVIEVSVYNSIGAQLFQYSKSDGIKNIDLSSLKSGLFLVKLVDAQNQTTVEKIIKK
ncbi:T9SS type A sorting domain-containing protein [Altibacter sp.]|uniref:T9SS type A sorting domain-containing protein n=1 Tax=Altibacter sp. TaxID=2024823 RepID=UPI0025862749|nr:T9SS type A sorting domain-containing protein [Altibacter sp.]MCW9037184.1 T9SS type A sorting domain-containing protein [Altibacter sp.]